jgi:hypothetical protein
MKTKNIGLLFLLMFCSYTGFTQNLTFDEVLSLRKKSFSGFEEYLNIKGWNFLDANEPGKYSSLGSVTFTYKKSNYDDKAESFINYYYSDYAENRLSIQIVKKDIYLNYLTRIKSLGMKLIKSEIEDGDLVKIYQGKTTTAKLTISSKQEDYSTSSKTTYVFFILTNMDFDRYF